MKLNNVNAVVTGAYGGIGRSLCEQLVDAGASVILLGRNQQRLRELQRQLELRLAQTASMNTAGISQHHSARISHYQVDLADSEQIGKFALALRHSRTPVNALINNAGVSQFQLLADTNEQQVKKMFQVNSLAPILLCRALLPILEQQPQARIVNVASVLGSLAYPGYSVYSASKYALRGFSQALARELADTNISVGCFLPRATRTDINAQSVVDMNQVLGVAMDAPEVVARQLMSFITSKRPEATVGWPEKLLTQINSLFPSIVSSAIAKQLTTIKSYARA